MLVELGLVKQILKSCPIYKDSGNLPVTREPKVEHMVKRQLESVQYAKVKESWIKNNY